jgi:hypothetical protein
MASSTAYGRSLDTVLGVVTDLHHAQNQDEITSNLAPMLALYDAKHKGISSWLGLGDMINVNVTSAGPFSSNVSDLIIAFGTRTFHGIQGNHDAAGGGEALIYQVPATTIYPGDVFAWDIGTKWRVLGFRSQSQPGYTIPATSLTWLSAQLSQAASDGRYVIVASHEQLGTTIPTHTQIVTPGIESGGQVVITSDTAGTFGTALVSLRMEFYVKQGSCINDDTSCWGWGTAIKCDGEDACTTGTTITLDVSAGGAKSMPKANVAADYWGWLYVNDMISNSANVRALLEAAGSSVVKLALNGHTHLNSSYTVNGIQYITLRAAYNVAGTGALLYLYTDGTWQLVGSGDQTSYNCSGCTIEGTSPGTWPGFSVNSGAAPKLSSGGTITLR